MCFFAANVGSLKNYLFQVSRVTDLRSNELVLDACPLNVQGKLFTPSYLQNELCTCIYVCVCVRVRVYLLLTIRSKPHTVGKIIQELKMSMFSLNINVFVTWNRMRPYLTEIKVGLNRRVSRALGRHFRSRSQMLISQMFWSLTKYVRCEMQLSRWVQTPCHVQRKQTFLILTQKRNWKFLQLPSPLQLIISGSPDTIWLPPRSSHCVQSRNKSYTWMNRHH